MKSTKDPPYLCLNRESSNRAIFSPAGQFTEHAAVSALGGLKLQDGVIDPKTLQKLEPNLLGKRLGQAQRLIDYLYVAGESNAG